MIRIPLFFSTHFLSPVLQTVMFTKLAKSETLQIIKGVKTAFTNSSYIFVPEANLFWEKFLGTTVTHVCSICHWTEALGQK